MKIEDILKYEAERQGLDPIYMTIDELIDIGGSLIFDFPYDMYNEDYKAVFEQKFFLKNYSKSIGYDTLFEFKRRLRVKLMELLPKYNRLYKLDEQRIDYFIGQLETQQHERQNESTNESTSQTSSENSGSQTAQSDTTATSTSEGGAASEECNKSEDQSSTTSNSDTRGSGENSSKGETITKNRPEQSAANNNAYARETQSNTSSGKDSNKSSSTGSTTSKSKGSRGRKSASANFQDTDGNTKSTSSGTNQGNSSALSHGSGATNAMENYIMTRTNNNADGMIERITDYISKIHDTDALLLDELDDLFSSIWAIY